MSKILILFSFLSFYSVSALSEEITNEESVKEYHSLDQMLIEVKLEKMQVEAMVDTMVKSGRLSDDEGIKARRAIASVQEDDIESIKEQAIVHYRKRDLANK